jgi:deaminated glutathione amidase
LIVTGIQINSNAQCEENLSKVLLYLEKARASQPDIIVLPEYSNYMGPLENAYSHGLTDGSRWHRQLSHFAKQNKVGIIAGLLLRAGDHKSTSSLIFFNKHGIQQSIYTKLHLFDIQIDAQVTFNESTYLQPGKSPVITEIDGIPCGFAICYDLRFPGFFRYLSEQKVRVIFVPAAFTEKTGKAHWELLVRTRALENQVFVVAVNQVGTYAGDKASYGHSMIVDPWGAILARAPGNKNESGEGLFTASLDFSYQDTIREKLPCLSHRREDLW